MKAYALDLRKRVVKFIQGGGSKAEAARRFELARSSVYRYLAAAKKGALAPKTSWGHWRKLDPQKLQAHVNKHPDATLKELQKVFGVSHHAIWVRLGQLGFTLKNTHEISRAQRGATVALPPRTLTVQRPDPSFTWMSAAWITACIVNTDARPGASGFIRRWRANGGTHQHHCGLPAKQAGRTAGVSMQLQHQGGGCLF